MPDDLASQELLDFSSNTLSIGYSHILGVPLIPLVFGSGYPLILLPRRWRGVGYPLLSLTRDTYTKLRSKVLHTALGIEHLPTLVAWADGTMRQARPQCH
ncbi:MAG: hypothetical protein AAF934_05755 [Bacteroidota bacterium]